MDTAALDRWITGDYGQDAWTDDSDEDATAIDRALDWDDLERRADAGALEPDDGIATPVPA